MFTSDGNEVSAREDIYSGLYRLAEISKAPCGNPGSGVRAEEIGKRFNPTSARSIRR